MAIDRRHHVFISSTYTDLQEERRQVMEVVLRMRCLPSGMELFAASNEEQLEMIKRVIDDCDYYLVIVAGRSGNLTAAGVSYTEPEYTTTPWISACQCSGSYTNTQEASLVTSSTPTLPLKRVLKRFERRSRPAEWSIFTHRHRTWPRRSQWVAIHLGMSACPRDG
jgi:hypothetical protein